VFAGHFGSIVSKGGDVDLEAKRLVRERPDCYGLYNNSALILRSCGCNVQQIELGSRSPSCFTARISGFAKLLIPTFDRLVPNCHVTNDLLALPLHPLFGGPRGGDRDRQQEY
jgi:hypothetical protein